MLNIKVKAHYAIMAIVALSYIAVLALVVMHDSYEGELNAQYHSNGTEYLPNIIVPVDSYNKIYIDMDGKVYEAELKDAKMSYLLGYIDKKIAASEKRTLEAIEKAKNEIVNGIK